MLESGIVLGKTKIIMIFGITDGLDKQFFSPIFECVYFSVSEWKWYRNNMMLIVNLLSKRKFAPLPSTIKQSLQTNTNATVFRWLQWLNFEIRDIMNDGDDGEWRWAMAWERSSEFIRIEIEWRCWYLCSIAKSPSRHQHQPLGLFLPHSVTHCVVHHLRLTELASRSETFETK